MTNLRKLTLATCKGTDSLRGIWKLTALTALTQLQDVSLIACRHLKDDELNFLPYLPELHSLTLFGNKKVCAVSANMLKGIQDGMTIIILKHIAILVFALTTAEYYQNKISSTDYR